MKKTIYLCATLATIFIACQKEDQPAAKSTRELLIEKKWYLKAINVTPALMGTTNLYDSLIPCQKDDIFTYRSSGKQEIDEGPLKCSPSKPQIDSATTWKIENNKLITLIDLGSQIFSDTQNIVSIDEKNLQLGATFKFGKDSYYYLYKYETR